MTASELAFLALGLLLGAASGAALLVVLGSRLPRREIRVTVTPNAVPRRSETLSQAAFVTSPAEPAPGGPGDRRWHDRDDGAAARGLPRPVTPAGVPVMADPLRGGSGGSRERSTDRTIVPSGPIAATSTAVGVAAPAEAGREPADQDRREWRERRGAALERILRGEPLAMLEVLDAVAGADGARRREWELLLGGLVDGLADMAVREGVIDFPMGKPFWDGLTVEQCRHVVGALASMGYRYDGRAGWVDGRVPAYRDLSQALADVGIEPRRMRAWPNSSEIASLFAGARPAPEELLAAAGPAYSAEDVRELLGDRAEVLTDLWLAWEVVRPALFDEAPSEVPSEVPTGESRAIEAGAVEAPGRQAPRS